MKYRLLREGEIVQKGDELLSEDTTSWVKVTDIGGYTYFSGICPPIRRLIEDEPAPDQKTLTVRIAVAVDPSKKEWNCAGWKLNGQEEPSDQVKIDYATEEMYGERQIYFIEAVIPIPEPPVIVGTVTEGEN